MSDLFPLPATASPSGKDDHGRHAAGEEQKVDGPPAFHAMPARFVKSVTTYLAFILDRF
jgi:hypothetical protein